MGREYLPTWWTVKNGATWTTRGNVCHGKYSRNMEHVGKLGFPQCLFAARKFFARETGRLGSWWAKSPHKFQQWEVKVSVRQSPTRNICWSWWLLLGGGASQRIYMAIWMFPMKNPIKIDDLGVPLFLETPISGHFRDLLWFLRVVLWWGPKKVGERGNICLPPPNGAFLRFNTACFSEKETTGEKRLKSAECYPFFI